MWHARRTSGRRKERTEESVLDSEGRPVFEIVLDEKGEPVPERDEKGHILTGPTGETLWKRREKKRPVTHVLVTKATRDCVIYEDLDTGPILLQKAVYTEPGDTPEILQRRVMEQAEWILLPKAIDGIANGTIPYGEAAYTKGAES